MSAEASRHATEVNELRGQILRLERERDNWKRLAEFWRGHVRELQSKLFAWLRMEPGAGRPRFAPTLCPWDAYRGAEIWVDGSGVVLMESDDDIDHQPEEVYRGCSPALLEVVQRNGWEHLLRCPPKKES